MSRTRRCRFPVRFLARFRASGGACVRPLAVGFLAVVVVLGIAGSVTSLHAAVAAEGELVHPQDGPHVDVKFRVQEEVFVVELMMNIVFLDAIMDFQRESPDRVDPAEAAQLYDAFEAWWGERMPATIDGVEVRPRVDGLELSDPDPSLLALFPRSGWRGLRKIRFQLVYPFDSFPDSIDLAWPVFPPDPIMNPDDPPPMQFAAEATAQGVREQLLLTEVAPHWNWRAGGASIDERLADVPPPAPSTPLRVPVASIVVILVAALAGLLFTNSGAVRAGMVLAGGLVAFGLAFAGIGAIEWVRGGDVRPPDEARATIAFVPLHGNLYKAFDYAEEETIYDALARSVDGRLLDTLYRSIRDGLVIEEEENAMSRVISVDLDRVDIDETDVRDDERGVPRPAFKATATWRVKGRVSHWGHVHERTNRYVARFGAIATDDGWRFDAVDLLEQERVDAYDEVDPRQPFEGDLLDSDDVEL